eukprot:Polyplicarium_translucidae@DN2562_c0_g1_i4.p1
MLEEVEFVGEDSKRAEEAAVRAVEAAVLTEGAPVRFEESACGEVPDYSTHLKDACTSHARTVSQDFSPTTPTLQPSNEISKNKLERMVRNERTERQAATRRQQSLRIALTCISCGRRPIRKTLSRCGHCLCDSCGDEVEVQATADGAHYDACPVCGHAAQPAYLIPLQLSGGEAALGMELHGACLMAEQDSV